MKKILATVLAAGALLAAAPIAAASPGSDDTLYVNMLDEYGIDYGTRSAAVKAAKAMCEAFDYPRNTFDGVAQTVLDNTTWTRREAAQFIGLSIAAYCPEHRSKIS